MKRSLFVIAAVSAAPALTFDRPTSSKKDVAFMPFKELSRPTGKDIIKDYTSEDGNTKYHAEFHYNTDDNKDGSISSSSMQSVVQVGPDEMQKMMDQEMKQIDALFGNMLKVPSFFGNSIFDRIFSNGIQDSEVIEEMEASGDGQNPLFFF
jgi:hypothetical protein